MKTAAEVKTKISRSYIGFVFVIFLKITFIITLFITANNYLGVVIQESVFSSPLPKSHLQMRIDDLKLLIANRNVSRTLYLRFLGRLGNNLFQYASAYAIARKTNSNLLLFENPTIFNMFSNIIFPFKSNDSEINGMKSIREFAPSIYNPNIVLKMPAVKQVYICCRLESWRYFEGLEEEIRLQYILNDDLEQKASQFISQVKMKAAQEYNVTDITLVGIHVRRGDKAGRTAENFGWRVPKKSYFMKAMEVMRKKYRNVYFILTSNDYKWCNDNIVRDGVTFSPPGTEVVLDFAYLTKCDHVIMSVGTFGWWAGWLAGGDVIYYDKPTYLKTTPYKWCNLKDLFPHKQNWMSLSD